MIVIRLTLSRSVRETASESMLKLRARMRLATRLRTPGRFMTSTTRMWRCAVPVPGRARGGGALVIPATDVDFDSGQIPDPNCKPPYGDTTNLKIEKSAKPKVCEDTGADWKCSFV